MQSGKKGLSDLVSNVLIILLVFASIAIMGVIILNLVKISGQSIENAAACKQINVKPVQCLHNITDANLLFATEYESGVVIDEVDTVALFSDGTSANQSIIGGILGNFETQSIRESRGDNNYDKFYTVTKFKDTKGIDRTCVSDTIGCTLYQPAGIEIVNPVNNPQACGPAARDYSFSSSGFVGNLCDNGAATPVSPTFPSSGQTSTWTCEGQTCSARRLSQSQQSSGGGGGGSSLPNPTIGSCGTSAYTCQSGSSTNNAQTTTDYTWTCPGSNGGSSATCTAPILATDYTYTMQEVVIPEMSVTGASTQAVISITSLETTHQAVTLTVGTLPMGVVLADSQSKSCTPTLVGFNSTCNVVFNMFATLASVPGTYTIPITATTANTPNKNLPLTVFIRGDPSASCNMYSLTSPATCTAAKPTCVYVPEDNQVCLQGTATTCNQIGASGSYQQLTCERMGCSYTGTTCSGTNTILTDHLSVDECWNIYANLPGATSPPGLCYDSNPARSISIISPTSNQVFNVSQYIRLNFTLTGFSASDVCGIYAATLTGGVVASNHNACRSLVNQGINITQPGDYYLGIETAGITPQVKVQVPIKVSAGIVITSPVNGQVLTRGQAFPVNVNYFGFNAASTTCIRSVKMFNPYYGTTISSNTNSCGALQNYPNNVETITNASGVYYIVMQSIGITPTLTSIVNVTIV